MLQELWDLVRLKLFSQVFIVGFIPLLSVVSQHRLEPIMIISLTLLKTEPTPHLNRSLFALKSF